MTDTARRPTESADRPGARSGVARRGLALLLVAMVVVYAPLAMEYTLHFWTPNAPRLWDHTLRNATDAAFEQGPRSVTAVQAAAYQEERIWLTLHTTMGGLALFLGIWQFSDRLRRTRARLHRRIGGAYVVAALLSLIGSAGFMVNSRRGDIEIYNGAPFEAGLWGVWVVTLGALVVSLLFLRAGDYRRHSEFMALSYAGLLTAPVLRLGWVLIARTSSLDQWDANLAFTTSLAPQTVLLAALWRSFRGGVRPLRLAPGRDVLPPRVTAGIRLLGCFGVVALANALIGQWGGVRVSPPDLFPSPNLAGQSAVAYAGYAAGAAVAMLLGARLLGSGLVRPGREQLGDPRTVAYLASVAIGTVGLFLLVAANGDDMLGGIVAVYYWLGVAFFWVLTTALYVHALRTERGDRAVEWGLHSVAVSMQSALFHLTYLALGLTGFADTTGRVITAMVLSFAGAVTLAYVTVALLGTPRPSLAPRGKVGAAGYGTRT